jgi:hypothetical protein
VIAFRNCKPVHPFLWDRTDQPAMRWNHHNDGPVQYLADTPNGAWAEFLRNEEIRDEVDLLLVRHSLWAVDIASPPLTRPNLDEDVCRGEDYIVCQEEGDRLKKAGAPGLVVRSAALVDGGASGEVVRGMSLLPAPRLDGLTIVLFGSQPHLRGWRVVTGAPPPALLAVTRYHGDP